MDKYIKLEILLEMEKTMNEHNNVSGPYEFAYLDLWCKHKDEFYNETKESMEMNIKIVDTVLSEELLKMYIEDVEELEKELVYEENINELKKIKLLMLERYRDLIQQNNDVLYNV